MAFENRVVRRIFGLKTDEMFGLWRKAHEELLSLYFSQVRVQYDQIKED
jgi:hypothetical protein